MILSSTTLTLMRQSAGAVIAAAAISGEAQAESPERSTPPIQAFAHVSSIQEITEGIANRDEPKKGDGEEPEKKEKPRQPCGPCGLG